MSGYNVAVVGATGNVGRAMLEVLFEREFPINEIHAVASSRSVGKEVSFGDTRTLKVQDLEKFDFSGIDIALFSPGGSISAKYAPIAAKQGCVVIDNTSHFRMMPEIPLVVPEVNAHALKDYAKTNIIANPNCSTIQMVVALAPLHKAFGIKRVVVSTYQSVSGAGKEGMDELYNQTKSTFLMDEMEPQKFPKRIAFNLIPQIDVFMDDGYTKEEWKMMVETPKIMESDIPVQATCVRVPVFVGHSESVNVEFNTPVTIDKVFEVLEEAEGIVLFDRREAGGYATPTEIVGEDATYISRLRMDPTVANGISFWCVADNVRKGAATNAVQIAEKLIADYGL